MAALDGFGNVLGVSQTELAQIAVLAAIVLIVVLLKRRDLTLFAFDPTHAFSIGLSPRLLGALLLGMLALTAVVALQVVGVVLVVALLIIPGATASLLTDRFGRMLLIAPALAVTASVVGIYLSYWWDASPGALVVLTQGTLFTIVFLASPRYGVFAARLAAARRARLAPPRTTDASEGR